MNLAAFLEESVRTRVLVGERRALHARIVEARSLQLPSFSYA
jgi:hypothetical protein